MTARALGVPLVIARRDNRSLEGSLVTISYMSGSGKIETMSLARRAVSEGQRALIIDDFMHAGGSVKGLADLMREFSIAVVGTGIVMTMAAPQRKMVDNYVALMQMHELSDGTRRVEPAQWARRVRKIKEKAYASDSNLFDGGGRRNPHAFEKKQSPARDLRANAA